MNVLMEKADNIIAYINDEMEELDTAERAMVLLYVCKLCKPVIDLDMVDAIDNADEQNTYNELDTSIPLPVDADGVPIRIGDVMEGRYSFNPREPCRFKVCGIIYRDYGQVCALIEEDYPTIWYRADECRHYHAPTVEDLLW